MVLRGSKHSIYLLRHLDWNLCPINLKYFKVSEAGNDICFSKMLHSWELHLFSNLKDIKITSKWIPKTFSGILWHFMEYQLDSVPIFQMWKLGLACYMTCPKSHSSLVCPGRRQVGRYSDFLWVGLLPAENVLILIFMNLKLSSHKLSKCVQWANLLHVYIYI